MTGRSVVSGEETGGVPMDDEGWEALESFQSLEHHGCWNVKTWVWKWGGEWTWWT